VVPEVLRRLAQQTKVESITASNAIEGVEVEAGRAEALVSGEPPRFRNRSEKEFAGYADALDGLMRADLRPLLELRAHAGAWVGPSLDCPVGLHTRSPGDSSGRRWQRAHVPVGDYPRTAAARIWPWTEYLIAVLAESYDDFENRVAASRGSEAGTKQERIRHWVLHEAPAEFKIGDVRRALPGVSDPTIRLALRALRDEGRLEPRSVGMGAKWRRL
jgi:hypothetical protein